MTDDRELEDFLAGAPSADPQLSRLAAELHRGTVPEPTEELVARTQAKAARELVSDLRRDSAPFTLRWVTAAAAPAAVCLLAYVWLLSVGAPWLAQYLPSALVWFAAGSYALAGILWLSLAWIALPPLAHALNSPATAHRHRPGGSFE